MHIKDYLQKRLTKFLRVGIEDYGFKKTGNYGKVDQIFIVIINIYEMWNR